MIKIIVICY